LPRHTRLSGEGASLYRDGEVAFAALAVAGVSAMFFAVVGDLEA
jgi:hypothetical protein